MNTFAPGSIISHYRIKALIARGGMGEVYKAVDTRLGRTVALKIPSGVITEDDKTRRRFLREAHAASRLSHPNICTIFEVGEEDGRPFIVMEFIEGPTIQELLTRAPLATEAALRIAIHIADALQEAHHCGIIHRDLKPSNIIINPRGMGMILDFGLAKRLRESESTDDENPTVMQSLTTEATVIGTVAYMSPEQVRARTLDARSDVFSFGILLYEMLTGQRPFTGMGQVEIMHSILHDEPPSPRDLRPELDEQLCDIVMHALRKDVDQRYRTIAELKLDLWQLIKEKGFDISGVITGATTGRGRADSATMDVTSAWMRRILAQKRSVWTVAAVIAAIIAITTAWVLWPTPSKTDPNLLSSLKTVPLLTWKSELGNNFFSLGRFSRDGRDIVYSKMQGGNTDLWIKQVNGGEIPVVGTQDAAIDNWPIFSPDDEQIAFVSNRGGSHGIWKIPRLGGTPELLAALGPGSISLVAWSRDAKKIYFDLNSNLFELQLEGRRVSQLTAFPLYPAIGRNFSISRQEDRIAFVDIRNGQRDIWMRPIGGGQAERVTNDAAPDDNPIWHPDGKRLVYNSTRNGVQQICMAFLDGREPVQISLLDVDCIVTDVSNDGTRIVYSISKDEADVWQVRIDSGSSVSLTSDVGVELWPDVSPNGQMVAYQGGAPSKIESGGLDFGLFVKSTAPGKQATLIASNGFAPQWSRDSQSVAFLRPEEKRNSLWTVRASGGDSRRISATGVFFGGFTRLPFNRMQTRDLAWSLDGQQIAFSDAQNIRIANVDGSGETQVTQNSDPSVTFVNPLWSPDGSRIAFLSWRRQSAEGGPRFSIWIEEKGHVRQVYEGERGLRLVGWTNSGRDVIATSFDGKSEIIMTPVGVDLYQIPADAGSPRVIAKLSAVYLHNIEMSADGRTVAYVARPENVDQLEIFSIPVNKSRLLLRSDDPRSFFAGLAWAPDGKAVYFSRHTNTRAISMIDHVK